MSGKSMFETHDVTNQSPHFQNINLFTSDVALRQAVAREGGDWAADDLCGFGAVAGSAQALEQARLANENAPKLRQFDSKGRRLDTVEFHPAYHELMRISTSAGLHCMTWEHLGTGAPPKSGRHVVRAAGMYMAQQMEAGHCCPVTMTNAVVPALLHQPDIASEWLPKILARDYDPAFAPVSQKSAATLGMGMTEKQGGTDVRANETRASPIKGGGPGEEYTLIGHKWFMSAPMCDAFLVLAQAPGGLSCFMVPRFLPDGTVNALHFQRLKDKLGNRSNASSEVEFHNCHGLLIGDEGRGVPTIIDMVTYTRLDCAVASAGLMRFALAQAAHHARHRTVFQRKLIDQPLMRQVLCDLALDVEAATALAFRLARSFDVGERDAGERAFARLMTPIIKYWICKVVPQVVYEAMECLGGNGYVEDTGVARLYREAPLNAIWEGSGNVMCLDVLRALHKTPDVLDAVLSELNPMAAGEPTLAAALERVTRDFAHGRDIESGARRLVEGLATVAAGCLLRSHGNQAVADAFISSRLEGGWRYTYGTAGNLDTTAILSRLADET